MEENFTFLLHNNRYLSDEGLFNVIMKIPENVLKNIYLNNDTYEPIIQTLINWRYLTINSEKISEEEYKDIQQKVFELFKQSDLCPENLKTN